MGENDRVDCAFFSRVRRVVSTPETGGEMAASALLTAALDVSMDEDVLLDACGVQDGERLLYPVGDFPASVMDHDGQPFVLDGIQASARVLVSLDLDEAELDASPDGIRDGLYPAPEAGGWRSR